MLKNHPQVKNRNIEFASRIVTNIWQEIPSAENPYLAESCRCHGYDLIELTKESSYIEVLYLLFLGELPTPIQSKLLETLFIGFINPGPRHPATRAAMNAGIGKTYPTHILPIGMSVLSGAHLGGKEVEESMRFIDSNQEKDPEKLVSDLLLNTTQNAEVDNHIAPGFGSRYGSIDPLPQQIASLCEQIAENGETLRWGATFASALKPHGMGWLATGVAAAVFCELNIHPRAGSGLFLLINAPGLLAHGVEMAGKPISAMPFLDEKKYIIDPKAKKRI